MKKNTLILFAFVMIAAMLVAAVKPAILTVKNRSDVDLSVYLYPVGEDGAVSETPTLFALVPFKSVREFELPPGQYSFEAWGCGAEAITGLVTIRGHFTLVLPNCERLEKALQQRDGGLKFLPD